MYLPIFSQIGHCKRPPAYFEIFGIIWENNGIIWENGKIVWEKPCKTSRNRYKTFTLVVLVILDSFRGVALDIIAKTHKYVQKSTKMSPQEGQKIIFQKVSPNVLNSIGYR